MLSSVEQAFVGREEIRAPLKTPAWEARLCTDLLTSFPGILSRSGLLFGGQGQTTMGVGVNTIGG